MNDVILARTLRGPPTSGLCALQLLGKHKCLIPTRRCATPAHRQQSCSPFHNSYDLYPSQEFVSSVLACHVPSHISCLSNVCTSGSVVLNKLVSIHWGMPEVPLRLEQFP